MKPDGGERTGFRPGQLVRIRSLEQISMTLDRGGAVDGLPFMPEMAAFCHQTHRVIARVDKTCVEGQGLSTFSNTNVYILDGLRCDGTSHANCSKLCILFWKECWLEDNQKEIMPTTTAPPRADLLRGLEQGLRECQSSALCCATRPMSRSALLCSSAVDWPYAVLGLSRALRRKFKSIHWRLFGNKKSKPKDSLGLKAGEWVQVKTRQEIEETLDAHSKHRGLTFTQSMVPFCGGHFQVLRRVDRIILEETGKMRSIKDTVILESVVCDGYTGHGHCPRRQYHFWREAWLERIRST